MTGPVRNARLLPWTNENGKPCVLFGDGSGYVARLADDMEAEQLDFAEELLTKARDVLAGRMWTAGEINLLAVQLTEALDDVHRIAVSRGARLPVQDEPDEPDKDAATEPWRRQSG